MGYLFQPPELRVAQIAGAGCWVEVIRARRGLLSALIRLELDLASPLTPRSGGAERLPRADDNAQLEIREGVWWCEVSTGVTGPVYLVVSGGQLRIAASKADAYRALGAVARLNELGLEDAAIALEGGDFDHASVQMIAYRQQRQTD